MYPENESSMNEMIIALVEVHLISHWYSSENVIMESSVVSELGGGRFLSNKLKNIPLYKLPTRKEKCYCVS